MTSSMTDTPMSLLLGPTRRLGAEEYPLPAVCCSVHPLFCTIDCLVYRIGLLGQLFVKHVKTRSVQCRSACVANEVMRPLGSISSLLFFFSYHIANDPVSPP